MALTLQRKLELAGDLAKVQPILQRLHLVEKPKKRRHVRNLILVSSAVGAGAVVLILMRRRRGCGDTPTAGDGVDTQADYPNQDTPTAESVREPSEGSLSA